MLVCRRVCRRTYTWHLVSGEGKRSEGKSKKEEALKIREEGEFDTGLGRAEFRVTKVILLFVRKVSLYE